MRVSSSLEHRASSKIAESESSDSLEAMDLISNTNGVSDDVMMGHSQMGPVKTSNKHIGRHGAKHTRMRFPTNYQTLTTHGNKNSDIRHREVTSSPQLVITPPASPQTLFVLPSLLSPSLPRIIEKKLLQLARVSTGRTTFEAYEQNLQQLHEAYHTSKKRSATHSADERSHKQRKSSLEVIPNNDTIYKPPPKSACHYYPRTITEGDKLLGREEEHKHSWKIYNDRIPEMLLRVWDYSSQSFLAGSGVNGFLARKSAELDDLNSAAGRKLSIERHGKFSNRHPTSFISTCDSVPLTLKKAGHHRNKRCARKPQPDQLVHISLINPKERMRRGWPIDYMLEEIAHYKCQMDMRWENIYKHEWLCPWQIHSTEIVWTWPVKIIVDWKQKNNADDHDWADKVARPMLRRHEEMSLAGVDQKTINQELGILVASLMPQTSE